MGMSPAQVVVEYPHLTMAQVHATLAYGNTGPLNALAKADQLSLLQILYDDVQIPPAVYREPMAKSGPEAVLLDLALAAFVRVVGMLPLPLSW
jgi:hypothetical protein